MTRLVMEGAGPWLALLLAGGCVTGFSEGQKEEMRGRTEARNLRADVLTLKERMGDVEARQREMDRDMQSLKAAQAQMAAELAAQKTQSERDLAALRQAQDASRQEIVGKLSEQISALLRSPAGRGERTERGRQHTVQRGQTLSEIAAAYGVTVDVIVRANGLKTPDRIQVGDTLFIPE